MGSELLAGKTAIVTGGGTLFGEAVAKTLISDGAKVLIVEINQESGAAAAKKEAAAETKAVQQRLARNRRQCRRPARARSGLAAAGGATGSDDAGSCSLLLSDRLHGVLARGQPAAGHLRRRRD